MRTSWKSSSTYTAADSEALTVFVGFPKSMVQFELDGATYILSNPAAAPYDLRTSQGIEEFVNIDLAGSGVMLTGEFIAVKTGQIITKGQTQTVTIPAGETRIRTRRGYITLPRAEQTITAPMNLPGSAQLVELPNDLTNNQFSLVLKDKGENNYAVEVRGIDNKELSEITQPDGNATILLDATTEIKEDTWYDLTARLSNDEITAIVRDANGTLLESKTAKEDTFGKSNFGILMTNNNDKIVAFKNLKIEPLNQPNSPSIDDGQIEQLVRLFVPYGNITIVIAAILVTTIHLKKRSNQSKKISK